jgi:hypothetical protein
MVALNGGKPELMNIFDMLRAFISFREDVVTRRTKYTLRLAIANGAKILVDTSLAYEVFPKQAAPGALQAAAMGKGKASELLAELGVDPGRKRMADRLAEDGEVLGHGGLHEAGSERRSTLAVRRRRTTPRPTRPKSNPSLAGLAWAVCPGMKHLLPERIDPVVCTHRLHRGVAGNPSLLDGRPDKLGRPSKKEIPCVCEQVTSHPSCVRKRSARA